MLQPQESVTVTDTQVLMHTVMLITTIQGHTLMIFLEISSRGPQLVKELHAFYETARFTTTCTSAHTPPVPIMHKRNPVHVPPTKFQKIHFNIIPPHIPIIHTSDNGNISPQLPFLVST
jgi:hypothetical protein